MELFFNPLNKACKSPVGALCNNEKLNIFVKIEGEGECYFLLRQDGQEEKAYPMQKVEDGFLLCINIKNCGLYWYGFNFNGVFYGKNNLLNAEKNCFNHFQLLVYSKTYSTPNWLKGGVIYQIFPDRFNKFGDFTVGEGKIKADWCDRLIYKNEQGQVLNNQFYGGNLQGIREKLDFLAEMGVTCIYLNPIVKAFSSHRYDTGNYLEIDEVLGDFNDLKMLINDAKSRGIGIIFDGVYNHVGSDSLYFNKQGNFEEVGAFQSQSSPYFSWFDFIDFPNKYQSWWGFESLPSIKKNSKEFQRFITEKVLKTNFDLGFLGVRLDVVDELSSSFVEAIRKSVKSINENAVIIGEVWEDATNKIAYGSRREYFLGNQLDSVMNYPLRNGIINFLLTRSVDFIYQTIINQINNYPSCALNLLMNCLSTHDSPRIISVLGSEKLEQNKDLMAFERLTDAEYEKGVKLGKIAYALAFTLYGVPSVYYGDEAGVWGNLDPYNRKPYPWGKENLEMVSHLKKLGEIRKNNQAFACGETNVLYAQNGVLIYERTTEFDQVLIGCNVGFSDFILTFDKPMKNLMNNEILGEIICLKSESILILKSE